MTQHIMIPKTNDSVTLLIQFVCATSVGADLGGMMASIKLNDEFVFQTTKINNMVSDRMLTTKLGSMELSVS